MWCEQGELDILRRREKSSGSASAHDMMTFRGILGEEFVRGEWGTAAEGRGTLAGRQEVKEVEGGGQSADAHSRA